MLRKKISQYYTREKFNRKVENIKRINRMFGQRGGIKL